jgi:hypothetical protein
LIYWGFIHSSIPLNHFNTRVSKLGLRLSVKPNALLVHTLMRQQARSIPSVTGQTKLRLVAGGEIKCRSSHVLVARAKNVADNFIIPANCSSSLALALAIEGRVGPFPFQSTSTHTHPERLGLEPPNLASGHQPSSSPHTATNQPTA